MPGIRRLGPCRPRARQRSCRPALGGTATTLTVRNLTASQPTLARYRISWHDAAAGWCAGGAAMASSGLGQHAIVWRIRGELQEPDT